MVSAGRSSSVLQRRLLGLQGSRKGTVSSWQGTIRSSLLQRRLLGLAAGQLSRPPAASRERCKSDVKHAEGHRQMMMGKRTRFSTAATCPWHRSRARVVVLPHEADGLGEEAGVPDVRRREKDSHHRIRCSFPCQGHVMAGLVRCS